MNRGGKFLGTVAMLSIAACSGEQGKLQIRPIGAPLAAGPKAVPARIAEARGQLALGNVALALEAFRKAAREDPTSIDAMAGVAACYDRMARFDLSRRHYESALAIAPGDPRLLAAFAASLDLQGRSTEAASVRAEINQRLAAAAPMPQPSTATSLPQSAETAISSPAVLAGNPSPAKPVQQRVSVQRSLPAPTGLDVAAKPVGVAEVKPAAVAPSRAAVAPVVGRSVTVALPPARPVAQAPLPPPPAAPPAQPAVERAIMAALPTARPVTEVPPAEPAVETTVKVALPAAPPVSPVSNARPAKPAVEPVVTVALPPARPVAEAPPPAPRHESAANVARAEPYAAAETINAKSGPRLERTSLREVALITTPAPKWRALTVSRTERSATVRFVPDRQAVVSLSGIRLLNAARVNRLAARTRSYLVGRGWSPMAIGDASTVRARSVIFYPPERRRTAENLAAQFGFRIEQRRGTRQIIVLLGHDAARVSELRARA